MPTNPDNLMKHIIKLILALIIALPAIFAADQAPRHTYTGEITGVVCAACSSKVKAGLGKLPGVQSVEVLPGSNAGLAKLVIVSTTDTLTADDANKALGEDAKHYNVTALNLAKGS